MRCVGILASPMNAKEFFKGFLLVDDTVGKKQFDKLVDVLNNLELNTNDIRGQSYVNVANMKEKHKGLQNRLKVKPRAFYTLVGTIVLSYTL